MTGFEWILLTLSALAGAALVAAIRYKIRCLHDRIRQAKEATESTRRLLTAEINRLQAAREALTLSHLEKTRALEATIQELRAGKLIPKEIELLAVAAKPRMESINQQDPNHSGENKLHRVKAQMYKDFPNIEHGDIGLAIEWAYFQSFRKKRDAEQSI